MVVSILLCVCFVLCCVDFRHVTQVWEALGQAKQPIRVQVLAKLLEVLKRRPCLDHEVSEWDKDDSSLLPLAVSNENMLLVIVTRCAVLDTADCLEARTVGNSFE